MNLKQKAITELKRVIGLLESGSQDVVAVKIKRDVVKTGLPKPDTAERSVLQIAFCPADESNPEGYDGQ